MAGFSWSGLDARGHTAKGTRESDSPKSLRAALRRDGVVVTDVTESRTVTKALGAGRGLGREVKLGAFFDRVKKGEIAGFTRQLATLLRAGLPLTEALGALLDQLGNPRLTAIISDVRTRVNEGSAFADALAKHPRAFEEVFVSMVRAGEAAGNLDEVLARLADFLEAQVQLRAKVSGALVYPILMVIVSALIMGLLMVAVVPRITAIYEDAGQDLPWNTRLLIFASSLIGGWWWLLLPLTVAAVWSMVAWTGSKKGRPVWDRFKLRLPVVGPLARQIAVARFTRTLGTMLKSGVPLLRSLDISKEILGNELLRKVVAEARDKIQQGESIAATLKRSGEFPSLVTHMIGVGERAGQLEQMLGNVAGAYELEVEMKLARLTTLLEPLIIVVMGGAVTFVVFSILMPILQMTEFAQ